nr:alkaline phosphatase PhoX [Halegenticoccus tardaugens]
MEKSVAAAVGASVAGSSVAGASASEIDESNTDGAPSVIGGELKRFANTAFGAEVTGPYVFDDGVLLFSNQHPAEDNLRGFKNPGVGYFSGFNFNLDGNGDNDDFDELTIPTTEKDRRQIRSSEGEYTYLIKGRDRINNGKELLGVTQTPDDTNVTLENFEGTQYGAAATNPDCNQFVPTNEQGTEGYLYTNWENSPGNVTRVPLEKNGDEWEADLKNAVNLANTEELRALGGTRINCYGDKTPWGTMVSSEENYAHPRVTFTNTVGDIVENGGEGLTGACQFWNRPNPMEVSSSEWSDEYNGGVYTQGAFALAGVEFLAYYLGAQQVNQGDDENTQRPIDDIYPNPYRYGYHLEFRERDGDVPEPIKHYVMGRASWEAPDFQNDHKTVYGCSDGDSKGIYKFVADEEIDHYDDPIDVAGTLYAPKITNTEETTADPRSSPATTNLEVEWIPLGHASNGELEAAIAEYDDVTQADYLQAHAESQGWRNSANSDNPDDGKDKQNAQEKLQQAIEEADREVIKNGNQNYITNEEIVEWASQWEERGHDGVDDGLKHIPFLETRAAAKEIGASIEFNKAEGVDSAPDADDEGGSYIYFGISEFNDDLADETGDIQMDRVDGGVVYRAEIESGYDVSTLEPVIVGPDFTDGATDADDALRNVDNVYVMQDGRVLCCEDGFGESQRSYPNDCLYVYAPE